MSLFILYSEAGISQASRSDSAARGQKLDCASLVQPKWNTQQRAAAQADCEFYNASVDKGGDAWGDSAAPDAALPAGKGKAEIRAAYVQIYARPGFRLSWHPDKAELFGSTYVVTSGRYESHSQREGREQVRTGRYVTVWRQQPDGSWRFVWDGGEQDKEQK
jgi:ketosteroid isomerase-like protein